MTTQLFAKLPNRWTLALMATGAVIAGSTVLYGITQLGGAKPAAVPTAQTAPAKPTKVTALGRLEPRTEVVKLSAPQPLDGDRVAKVLVKPGNRVRAGQVVAVLDARDRLQVAVLEAQEKVRNAQARLAQVQAGAKAGELQAQQATIAQLEADLAGEQNTQRAEIARWQAEVNTAQAEYNRFQSLYREGATSASQLDSKRLALETNQAQLNAAISQQNRTANATRQQIQSAKATLNQIAEVRPVDVKTAQTEVDMAIAAAQRAETDLEQATIRAPMAGQILKVHARAGEKIGDDGLVELGQTQDMVVVAEVYQTDINNIKPGQQATITGQGFTGEVKGRVYEVGLQVVQQRVFSSAPGENLDRRVVEVKIQLDPESSRRVAGLTNLQVQTAIQL
jgi:HlyD family secretion protein